MSGWQDAPRADASPAWAAAPVAQDSLTPGDLGDGGEPVINERLPVVPMPSPPRAPIETPEEQARVASAKAGVLLKDIPEEDRLGAASPEHVAWVAHNAAIDPEQGTIAADTAPTPGAAAYTAAHLPAVQQQDNQQAMAADLARAPGVASYAAQSPAHAAAVKDDTSILSDIENAITGDFTMPNPQQMAFSNGVQGHGGFAASPLWLRGVRNGLLEQRSAAFEAARALGYEGLPPKTDAELAEMEKPPGDAQPEDKSLIGKAVGGFAGTAPYMIGAIALGAVGRAWGGKAGEAVALGAWNLWETFGPAVQSLRNTKNPDGSPRYSPDQVRNLAILSAAGQTVAMTAVQEATGHVFGAPLVRAQTNEAITSWLNTGGFNLVRGFVARYGFHAIVGGVTVAAQHAIQVAAEEAGKAANGQPYSLTRPFSEFGPAFKEGIESMILPAALGPSLEVYHSRGIAPPPKPELLSVLGYRAVAEQEQAKLESMIGNAEQSALVKRSPTQAAAALAPATAQHGAADTAYIDKEAFDKAHGPLAEIVAAQQGGNYPEAHALGAPVTIPLEAHLASVADGKARELLRDTKLTPDSKTPNELTAEGQPSLEELLRLAGKTPEIRREDLGDGNRRFTASLAGKDIGQLQVNADNTPGLVSVDEAHQRKGVATSLYQAAEKEMGKPLGPGRDQTAEGEAFRAAYEAQRSAPPKEIPSPPPGEPLGPEERRAELRAQVDAEAEADPAGRALKVLQDPSGAGQKLDRQFVRDQMGPAVEKWLDALGVLKHGQMNPNDLANGLGFANAHELAHSIMNPDLTEQGREMETERRLLAEFPDANKSDFEVRLDQATAEMKALREEHQKTKNLVLGGLDPSEDDLKAVKTEAEAGVNAKAIGDIDPRYYVSAERAAANRAAVASAKGDIQAALDAKRQQVQAMYAARAAREVRAEMGAARVELDRAYTEESRKALGAVHPEYLNGLDIAMEAIGARRRLAPTNWYAFDKNADRKAALAAAFKRMFADGYPSPAVPQTLADLVNPPKGGTFRDWSKLTPEEARAVADAINGLHATARSAGIIAEGNERAALGSVVQAIQGETAALPSIEPAKYTSGNPKPAGVRAREFLNRVNGNLLEFNVNTARLGPTAHKVLFELLGDARTYRDDLTAVHAPFFEELVRDLPPEVRARAYERADLSKFLPLPEGAEPLANVPRTFLYLLHAHRMSDGNMDRVLNGPLTLDDPAATRAARAVSTTPDRVPAVKNQTPWTQENVDFLLDKNPATRLTRAEADLVQAISDHLSKDTDQHPSLWSLIKQKAEDRFGIAPPKVAGAPRVLTFADGTSASYEGGYFPLFEDRPDSARKAGTPESINDFFGDDYHFIGTANGFAKERAFTAKYMVDLTWDSLPHHVSQVIHDLAFGDWVRGAGRLALDSEFKATADRVLGSARADGILNQIRTVAQGRSDSVIKQGEGIWKGLDYLKRAATSKIIGYSIPMALLQYSHFFGMVAGGKVSLTGAVPALLSLMRPGAIDALHEVVPELRRRDASAAELMGGARRVFTSERQGAAKALVPLDLYREHQGDLMHMVDTHLSAWLAQTAISEGKARGMSDAEAYQYAGNRVQDLMPEHSSETVAPILQDKKLAAAALIMYGFKSKLYNRVFQDTVQPMGDALAARDVGGVAKAGLQGIQSWAMLTTLSVVGKLLSGGGPEKDESKAAWLTRTALAAPGLILPFAGEAFESGAAAVTRHLPDWWTRDSQGRHAVKTFSYSAMEAPGGLIAEKFKQLASELAGKQHIDQKALELLGAIMPLLQAGAAPIERQATYLNDWRAGRVQPRGPGDVAAGLLGYSTSKRAARNVPTMLQDKFSPPGTSQRRGK